MSIQETTAKFPSANIYVLAIAMPVSIALLLLSLSLLAP